MKGRVATILAAVCLIAFVAGMLALLVNSMNLGNSDYIAFWAAGKQLIHHNNPYDANALLRMQRQQGLTGDWPNVSLDMPSGFFLVLPLGLFSAKMGAIVWYCAFVFSLTLSVRLLYIMEGRPPNSLHMLCYLFTPWYICLLAAQLGTFMLLGAVLFLYLHKSQPFWAGASLLLCALKPHLFLPFAIVLFAWILYRKAYPILAGFAAALATSCALSYFFDPHAWSEYSSLVQNNPAIVTDFIPTISVLLRFAIDRDAIWLQYLPAAAACVWGLWYFWNRRAVWNWHRNGALLLLISVLCAPHGWIFDEVVVLPAILAGLYAAEDSRWIQVLLLLLSAVVLIEFLNGARPVSRYYLWTAPAWFVWYLIATHRRHSPAH